MILHTFDGFEVYVTKQQADAIGNGIANGTKMINIDGTYIAASNVAAIVPGGHDAIALPEIFKPEQELNPEQYEAQRRKMAELRERLYRNLGEGNK